METLARNGLIIICVKFIPIDPLSANPTKWSNTLKQFVFPKRYIHTLQKISRRN